MSSPQPLVFGSLQGDSKAKLEQELQMDSDSDKDKDQNKDIDPKTGRLILPKILCVSPLKYELDKTHHLKQSEKEFLKTLTEIDLTDRVSFSLNGDDCRALAAFIKKYCPRLKNLKIHHCYNFNMLKPLIDSTSTIEVLELGSLSLFGWDFNALGEILKTNTSLRKIIVRYAPSMCDPITYGPLIDALKDNVTLLEIEGLNLNRKVTREDISYFDLAYGRTITHDERNVNIEKVTAAFDRNRKIQELTSLRSDIRALFLDAPLKTKKSDPKLDAEEAEEFDIEAYEDIKIK